MFNIEKFLAKFSKTILEGELQKKQFSEIIKKNTGVDIPIENIEIKNCVIYVNSSPSAKNKLFIEKNQVLEEISAVSQTKIIDIK